MIFLRAERSSPCASAVFVSLVYVVANIVGVMADTSYTGPPLLYSLYGPGGGCVDAGFMMPGSTTAAAAVGESTICETDVLDTPDGSFDVYTKFVMTSCGTDVLEATLYNCQDSACGECDTEPETVGHLSVANVVDLYIDVETCWQFYLDSSATVEGVTFGDQDGLTAQRFDATTDLSNLQDYLSVLFVGGCGDAWFTDNILSDAGPIGGPGPDGCIPGSDWCPELDECIQGFAETCPIGGGVAFSGGSTLSCDNGRCSTDTKCEWSDGSATFGTFYWTNLNGDVTLEDCVGITCTGCVTSDATGTDETEMDMEMDADMSDSDNAEMDAVMDEGDGMTMDGNETDSGMEMGSNETDVGMADMDPNGIIEKLGACVSADSGDIDMQCIQGVLTTLDPAIIGQLAQCAGGGSIAEMQACVEEQLSGEGSGDMSEPPMENETLPEEGNTTMPEDTTSRGAFTTSFGFVGVSAIALVAGLFL